MFTVVLSNGSADREVDWMVQWTSENKQLLNITPQAEAEISRTAEYVIESHVTGHIKAPHLQRAKDK